MKIIAFGASASRSSINKELATFVAGLFAGHDKEILDLNDYHLPLFTVDLERENGIPEDAKRFHEKLREADLLVISMAEHNSSYTAYFKNLFDWVSRYDTKMFADKKILLLSTSTGGRGGRSVLEAAKDRFPRHGAEIVATFSLPNFADNFNAENGILDPSLKTELMGIVEQLRSEHF